MARLPRSPLDRNLEELSPEWRWREWMGRVEAVIFASAKPVGRSVLAALVGESCNLDLVIQDIRNELTHRPYELVMVAGGYHFRTRPQFAAAIHAAGTAPTTAPALSRAEMLILTAIAYFQPITRAEIGGIIGKDVSRDVIAKLRGLDFIAAGPRSPQPGAPYTYITTDHFLSTWGLESIHNLPDMEKLQDAGLLSKHRNTALDGIFSGGDGELPEIDDEEPPLEPLASEQ
jgi:segregation and condensation protein B